MAYTQSQKPSFWQLLIIGYLNKIIWWKNTGHGFVDILQNLSKKIFKSDSVSEVPQKIHFFLRPGFSTTRRSSLTF